MINPSLDVELLIILDSSTLQQISPLDRDIKKAKKIAVIDHHAPHKDTKDISDFYIVDESASSTAEIIYGLIEDAGDWHHQKSQPCNPHRDPGRFSTLEICHPQNHKDCQQDTR